MWGSDPTIFAWELCNECHTSDNYEINRGLVPGSILYNWQVEMSAYLKTTLGVKSMVTNGNEGYRARGQYGAPLSSALRDWQTTSCVLSSRNERLRSEPHQKVAEWSMWSFGTPDLSLPLTHLGIPLM